MKKTVIELWKMKKTNDPILRVIGAGFSMGIPLFLGLYLGNMQIGTFGCFGAFAFLSYQPLPLKKLIQRIVTVGVAILTAFFFGMLATLIPWTIPIVISLVSLIGFMVCRAFKIPNPGPFFVIMVCSMGTGMKLHFPEILQAVAYAGIGVLSAVVMAAIVGYINQNWLHREVIVITATKHELILDTVENDSRMLLSAIHDAGIIFFAAYIGQSLDLGNPYWITISCAAVLQGRDLKMVFHRNIQRIVGGMVGLFIGALLLNLHLPVWQVVPIIVLLNLFVEFCMVRNYGIANFFTTPLSLLLANLSREQFAMDLVEYRFWGIVLGSLIGLAGAFLITYSLKMYDKELSIIQLMNKKD